MFPLAEISFRQWKFISISGNNHTPPNYMFDGLIVITGYKMEKIEQAMEVLGYSRKWIEYGLIDKEYICKEYERFMESEDKHSEHYRYGSFNKLLKRQDFCTDENIKYYIDLAILDKDQVMAISAIRDLICCKYLSEKQFVRLLEFIPINNPILEKVYYREKLLHLLSRTNNLTQEIFDLMLSTNDSVIHFALIDRNDLSYSQLLLLSTSGKNKAIRNLAKVALRKSHKVRSCL